MRVYGFGQKTAKILHRMSGKKGVGKNPVASERRGGGKGGRFFVTLEDFSADGPCYAKWVSRVDNTSRGTLKIYSYGNIMTGALAGYKCICTFIDGEWCVSFGPCVNTCVTNGTVSVGTAPDGTKNAVYAGHTVTGTNLNANTFAASGLPTGLSMSTAGAISGTPTEAGEFFVIVTATAPGTGADTGNTCTITKVLPLTINEA